MEIDPTIEKTLRDITDKSDTEPKFGAVIAYGTHIITTGFAYKAASESDVSDDPLLVIHAEESALLSALQTGKSVKNADIYVIGIRHNGETRFSDESYSCVVCSRLLLQTEIAHVIYPTQSSWQSMTVTEMFKQAIARVKSSRNN